MVRSPYLDWAVASAPLEGEPESGDLHLVKGISTGLLLAVVDGLGHGVEAAAVARRGGGTLGASPREGRIALSCGGGRAGGGGGGGAGAGGGGGPRRPPPRGVRLRCLRAVPRGGGGAGGPPRGVPLAN